MDDLEFTLARGRGRVTLTSSTFTTSQKIPEEVFRTGETRVVADLLDADMADLHDAGTIALGIRKVVVVPLNLVRYVDRADALPEDRRIAAWTVDSRVRGRFLSSATRSALETLAAEAAVAIETRDSIAKDTRKSETGAREYGSPLTFNKRSCRSRALIHPSSKRQAPACRVGPHPPRRFLRLLCRKRFPAFSFVVGDVAGKGPSAALMSALMQGMCRLFLQDAEEPGIALASMNSVLHQRAIESRFVTLVTVFCHRPAN